MSARRLALLCASVLGLVLVTGCDFTDFEETAIETLALEANRPPPTDLIDKAVDETSETLDKIEKADNLLQAGLSTHELAPLREAAKLRPRDPTYAFYLDAMEIALGLDSTRAEGRKLADEAIQNAHDPRFKTARQTNKAYVGTLIATRSHFPEGSQEQKRLRNTYCVVLAEYERMYKEPLETPQVNCDGIR